MDRKTFSSFPPPPSFSRRGGTGKATAFRCTARPPAAFRGRRRTISDFTKRGERGKGEEEEGEGKAVKFQGEGSLFSSSDAASSFFPVVTNSRRGNSPNAFLLQGGGMEGAAAFPYCRQAMHPNKEANCSVCIRYNLPPLRCPIPRPTQGKPEYVACTSLCRTRT